MRSHFFPKLSIGLALAAVSLQASTLVRSFDLSFIRLVELEIVSETPETIVASHNEDSCHHQHQHERQRQRPWRPRHEIIPPAPCAVICLSPAILEFQSICHDAHSSE